MPSSEILESLRDKGHRLTKARKTMVSLFENATQPLSAPELVELLAKNGIKVNKTTIYRELDFLLKEEIISELDLLDGKKRYELHHKGHHHHHLVCTICKKVICADFCDTLHGIEAKVLKKHHFKVTGHLFELFGQCEKCAR